MNNDTLQRFSRTELLIGEPGLNQLNREKVAVIGLGGVGSYAVEALARAGVGWLILADHDDICLSNTNRQLHALEGNYGRSKVEVMTERVKAINPEIAVVGWQKFVTEANLETILHGRISYVVDAIDTVTSKVALIQHCQERGIPIISALGTGNKLDPSRLQITDISKTHTCPLAKAVREMLRERGITSGVKVIFSTESPVKARQEFSGCNGGCHCPHHNTAEHHCAQRRQIPGSMSYLSPIAGLMMAGEVIRELLSGNEPGKLIPF